MNEKAFENAVKEYLASEGCWYLKTWSNGVQREGVPDLLVCCNGYFVGVELKAEHGKPSDLQMREIGKITDAGGFAMVLYPSAFERFKAFICDLKKGYFSRKDEAIWR